MAVLRGSDDETGATGSDMTFTVSSPRMEPPRPDDVGLARREHPEGSGLPAVREVEHRARRWHLARDLAVFQAKLFVDGIKDLVLAPVSLVAALVGLLLHRDDPGRPFYAVLRLGHGFDRWVNLFGQDQRSLPPAPDRPPQNPSSSPPSGGEGLDAYVTRVEQALVEQYRRGGLTAKAKDAIDQAIDTLHQRGGPPPR